MAPARPQTAPCPGESFTLRRVPDVKRRPNQTDRYPLYKGEARSSFPLIEIDSFMDRKAVTLCVLICLVVAFLLSISNYYIYLMRSPMQAMPGFAALILRDGALIVFVAYLYRRG